MARVRDDSKGASINDDEDRQDQRRRGLTTRKLKKKKSIQLNWNLLASRSPSPAMLLLSPTTRAIAVSAAGHPNLIFYCPLPRSPHHRRFHHKLSSLLLVGRHFSSLQPVVLPEDSNDSGSDASAEEEEQLAPSSAAALAAAIRRASPASPVRFTQRVVEQQQHHGGEGRAGLILPSPDFQRLCLEQLDLFRMVVDHDAVLSVYVRPAGSYVMDQLELRRIAISPANDVSDSADCVILIGNFAIPAGLRAAEAMLSKLQVEVVSDCGAIILPLVKQPFVVGFIVAELLKVDLAQYKNRSSDELLVPFNSPKDELHGLAPPASKKPWEIQAFKEDLMKAYGVFTIEQRSRAISISRSLAMAYVMDQKAILLQQSSWQNNIRMSHLIEQIRGPLSSIRALTKMLSFHVKRSETSYDIVEDILVQGEHIKDSLQKLQEAVFFTKANIVRYNESVVQKIHDGKFSHQESLDSLTSDNISTERYSSNGMDSLLQQGSEKKDIEIPMPPLWLMPRKHHNLRPCVVSDILKDLVTAADALSNKQERLIQLIELYHPLQVGVEESALRQALSNLIEGALLRTQIGGEVLIYATAAPAGGALIIIDDDGPDMHYMTQLHSLSPFGPDLFSNEMIEDNVTWNFVAGITVAREILEDYGCVMRVISPRVPKTALGMGGTRVELWFPELQPHSIEVAHEA